MIDWMAHTGDANPRSGSTFSQRYADFNLKVRKGATTVGLSTRSASNVEWVDFTGAALGPGTYTAVVSAGPLGLLGRDRARGLGMGQLHDAVGSIAGLRRPVPPKRWSRSASVAAASFALVAALAGGCAPVVPTGPTASGGSLGRPVRKPPRAPGHPPPSSPGVGRLVWLVDRAGRFGIWTTDLAGADVRTYRSDLDEVGTSLRDARLVGEDVVVIRDGPTAELWILSPTAPPRLLLDNVNSFVQSGARELVAVRDVGTVRAIWRVPLDGPAAAVIAELPVPDHGPQVGPFGFAISPDGRTVAAGWVGGPVEVIGPKPGEVARHRRPARRRGRRSDRGSHGPCR